MAITDTVFAPTDESVISSGHCTLDSWKAELPCPNYIEFLESIGANFHGLELTVTGSKVIDGLTCHYNKKKAMIPSAFSPKLLAKVLLTVLSTKVKKVKKKVSHQIKTYT